MNVVPGFRFIMCFKGEAVAHELAIKEDVAVMFFRENARYIALKVDAGEAISLRFQTKQETFAVYKTIQKFLPHILNGEMP